MLTYAAPTIQYPACPNLLPWLFVTGMRFSSREPALGVPGGNKASGFGVKGAQRWKWQEVGERSPRSLRTGPSREQPGRQRPVAILLETRPDTLRGSKEGTSVVPHQDH